MTKYPFFLIYKKPWGTFKTGDKEELGEFELGEDIKICDDYDIPELKKNKKMLLHNGTCTIAYQYDNEIFEYGEDNKPRVIDQTIEPTLQDLETLQLLAQNKRRSATERMVNLIREQTSILTTQNDVKSEIYTYHDGIYQPNGESFIRAKVRGLLGDAYTTTLCNEVIAKIIADTYITEKELYKEEPPNLICLKNGVFNITEKKMYDHSPKYKFFTKIPVEYNPTLQAKKSLEFLRSIVEKESDVQLLQEFLGYCLYRKYPIEKAFMLWGKGRNGKGQFLELLKNFLGLENCSGVSLQRLSDESSFDISNLHKKLCNIGGDLSDGYIEQSGIFKSLTGDDFISAKRKFLPDIQFKNYAKLIFACNQLPKSRDNSQAYWDRWVLLVFPYRFEYPEIIEETPENEREYLKTRKNNIIEDLTTPEELSGLLNWSLEGLHRLLDQGHFTFSESTKKVKDRWRRLADSLASFCEDHIVEDYDRMIEKQEFKTAYHLYCKANKIKPVGDKAIKTYLTTELGAFDNQKYDDGNRYYVWSGIKFNADDVDNEGFSTYNKISNFSIGVKTLVSHVTQVVDKQKGG